MTDFLYGYPAHDVTRDFFFTVSDRFGIFPWIFLGLCVAAFTVFIVTLLARLAVWRTGLKDEKPRFEWGHVSAVLREIVFHKRTLREMNGIMDAAVFYGLAGLSVLYVCVLAQEYITVPAFGVRFITGHYYIVFTLLDDLFSMIALAGVTAALIRRLALKPSSVVTGRNERIAFSLALFFLVSGFVLNALRIAVSGSPDFEAWAPFSFVISKVFSSFSEDALTPVQAAFWFLHALSGLLIAAAGASFFFRRLTVSFLNVYACPPVCRESENKYTVILSGDRRVTRITDFRAKQLMDLDACTGCGRCQDACPAFLAEKPLSPKKLINDLSRCLDEHTDKKNPKEGIVDDYVKNDGYWSCAMCGACSESCPSMINHMQKIIELRKSSDVVPEGFAQTLTMIEVNGTTSESIEYKGTWYAGINGVAPLSESGNPDIVYFAGCGVADESGRKSARAFLSLLRNAGVSVGVFGAEETCCGDTALRAGNEQLFRKLAVKNLELFARYKVKRIITSCPHGYNVL
ncbi:MAG TPA: (Fe-S)-binding protein, partial [Spirochaetota bacterium]|nr:(Fe-S)-binding protein [Spirochaetota bacterium]